MPSPRQPSRGATEPSPVPGGALVRLAARLVPPEDRRAWAEEWRAELGHAWDHPAPGTSRPRLRLALVARALGAVPDALEMRRATGGDHMLVHDLRLALRRLLRRPGFAALVSLTLALGIGAATAVFTVVDGVLLRPLPYAHADRLVELGVKASPAEAWARPYVAPAVLDEWRRQPALFDAIEHHHPHSVVLTVGEPRQLRAEIVSGGFFHLLGVAPQLGRALGPGDADGPSVVLSDELWRGAFGADPAIVGRTIALGDARHVVVGVMPRRFHYPRGGVSLWMPAPTALGDSARAGLRVEALARLRAGLPLAAAQASADRVAASLAAERPEVKAWYLGLTPMGEWRANPDVRRALLVLAGAVGFVLLIACANAANLLLVQATARKRELAVRLALGATRWRVVRELGAEALLLAAAGGIGGVLLAALGVRGIMAIVPSELVSLSYTTVAMDGRVLLFAVAASTLTALLFGLAPAFQATRRRAALAGGDRAGTGTVEQRRLRAALAAGQLALSMMLLVGAGLLAHSFARLVRVDPGADLRGLALLDLSPVEARYPTRAERAVFYDAVLERLRATPGVVAASVVSGTPGSSSFSFGVELEAEGAGAPVAEQPPLLPFGEADTSYFRTLGVPIRQGRAFAAADLEPGSNVAIVSDALARLLWADGRALGRRFRLDAQSDWLTVVGVAGDVKLLGPDDREGRFQYYRPVRPGAGGQRTIAVRAAGDPATLLPALKAAVWSVDPEQPFAGVETAVARYREPLAKPRFLLTLMLAFAGVAALLAAVGLYGVIAYTVAQRTREIGIRLAIGARASRVVAGVVREGTALALLGIGVGLAGALALGRLLETLLFGVSATDPATLAAVAAGLALLALLATWIPARRASRVDPVIALREE